MKQLCAYLISDSTGDTIRLVASATLSQFDDFYRINYKTFSLVKTANMLTSVLSQIDEDSQKVVVFHSVINKEIEDAISAFCLARDILCLPVISDLIDRVARFLDIKIEAKTGRQHELDVDYFKKIEAINYTISHDDGSLMDDLYDADIIIIGASRTSKSPTSVFLACRGFKVANVPFVVEDNMPQYIKTLTKPLIVGLTIDPNRLEVIRKARIKSLNFERDDSYANLDLIRDEVARSKRYFAKLGCHVINVTEKSVEEVAVYIVNLLQNRNPD